ncbi:MAG: hypothetical protein CFE44_03305 [Burkholderiales bacterium PBB4]|nr:MAG: hypothetical protein CFE44_03305 [Burkholderiales bacterium PBB4]
MQQFLATHFEIDNLVSVAALKVVVRHNMVLAYPLLVLGLVAMASALMLLLGRGLTGYLCMGIFLLGNGLSTRRMKALEQLVRSLPATSGECAQAQAEVNQRWKKRLWPNF